MAGELLDIGFRPKEVASFNPPDAERRYREWRGRNADRLADVPPEQMRVEYGRTGTGLYVRVRIDEDVIPEGLS